METKIASGFLVSSPHMKDPYFEKTVVFMLEHDNDEGSFGIILNKSANIDLISIFNQMGLLSDEKMSSRQFGNNQKSVVLEGGPVTPELGWIIHSLDWKSDNTIIIKNEIGVTASKEILTAIAQNKGPAQFLMCLGYAGWGPGQLVKELKTGDWINVSFDEGLFFNVAIDQKWDYAISLLGIDSHHFAPSIGDA